jgi:hypothetical protein
MDIPNNNTFKILEERKSYLIKKNEDNGNKNGHIQAEIKSLDKIINFSKLILNSFPNELIEKAIIEYESNNIDEHLENKEEEEIVYTYEENITKTNKINISFVKNKENMYIKLEQKKYVKNKYKWENRGKYYMSLWVLEEILKKAKEIGIK